MASRYARKAAQLRELINTKYYDAEKGLYANGSQAAQGAWRFIWASFPKATRSAWPTTSPA